MKVIYASTLLSLAMTLAVNAFADEKAQQIINTRGCVACHATDSQRVGPSFKAISEHYDHNKENVAFLVGKIRAGGAGSFGEIPMPPHGQVSEEEIRVVVEWIFTL